MAMLYNQRVIYTSYFPSVKHVFLMFVGFLMLFASREVMHFAHEQNTTTLAPFYLFLCG